MKFVPPAEAAQWVTALDLLRATPRADVLTFNAAVSALAKAREWWRALNLLELAAASAGVSETARVAGIPLEHILTHILAQAEQCQRKHTTAYRDDRKKKRPNPFIGPSRETRIARALAELAATLPCGAGPACVRTR